MTIGEAMRQARKSRGFTQRRLAKKSGVSGTTISNCENDTFFPSILTLISIADVLDVSIDELIGREFKKGEEKGND